MIHSQIQLLSHIDQVIKRHTIGYSIEVFPPKTPEGLVKLKNMLTHICTEYSPTMVDVTYCAGGNNDSGTKTLSLCQWVQDNIHIPSCAHLVLRGSNKKEIISFIDDAVSRGIYNIMALRGDNVTLNQDPSLCYASDLITLIRQYQHNINIVVASYPEGHPDCSGGLMEDINHLKYKLSCGADVVITQFFLDSEIFLQFRDQIREKIAKRNFRLIPGIILLSTISGLWRMIKLANGSISVPQELKKEITILEQTNDKDAIREWGLKLACRLCQELYDNGERFFHIYTLNSDESVCRLLNFINTLPQNCPNNIVV